MTLKNKEFLYTQEGIKYLKKEYYNKKRTLESIAQEFSTNKTFISRLFKKIGITALNRSEAQKNAIEKGTAKHPSLGIKKTEEEKLEIAKRVKEIWKNKTKEEIELHRKKARENFLAIPEEIRKEYNKKSIDTNRLIAAKKGSRLEKYIVGELLKKKYKLKLHQKYMIENQEMHIDIFLPEFDIAIEVDGPYHFKNIHGMDILRKRVEQDNVKNWLLVSAGYTVIRAQFPKSYVSNLDLRNFTENIIKVIEYINYVRENDINEFNSPEERIICLNILKGQ